MPVESKWLNEGRVTYGRWYGNMTVEEIKASNQDAIERLNEGTSPVYFIVDTLEVEESPNSFGAVKDLGTFMKHENLGAIVYVVENRMISFLNKTIGFVNQVETYNVKTIEEALAQIEKLEPGIVLDPIETSQD